METLPFTPVILGGNRGTYGLARAFYEAYGVQTVVISAFKTGPILGTPIITYYQQEEMTNVSAFQKTIRQIETDYPDTRKLIFGSDDRYVEMLINLRHQFSYQWIIPYAERETYLSVTDKHRFYDLCESIGVPYPRTFILEKYAVDFSLSFPVIIKPAQTPAYQQLQFTGKKKVYICQDEAEAEANIALVRRNGYEGQLVIQEYIPGEDASLGIVTAYAAKKDKQLKLISFANVLVDDPTPSAIGNSLAGIVREEKSLKESVQKIFDASGFYGFATFDVKFDVNRNRYVFFELNGRLGSSNYYVTAAGNNVATYYIEDFLYDRELKSSDKPQASLYTILPKPVLMLSIRSKEKRQEIRAFYQAGNVVHPLLAPFERSWRRKWYVLLSGLNYWRKLRQFPSLERHYRSFDDKKSFYGANRVLKDILFHKNNG